MQNDADWIASFNSVSKRLHFKETPVSVEQFINDDKFLGKLTRQGEEIYPRWKKELDFIMKEHSKYVPVFTGAIGCLAGDVKVSLLDGRELTIPQIMKERKQGKRHWTYSYDIKREKLVPGKVIDALLSGTKVENIVEVEIDKGEKIKCTHNHPFLLSSGKYKNAEDLQPGDSLMPLYRYTATKGYELIGAYKGQWRSTFHLVSEEINGPTPKYHCIHHKDCIKENNSPENLEVMTCKAHWYLHGHVLSPFKTIPGFASECAKKSKRWTGPGNEQQRKEASDRLEQRNKEGQGKRAVEKRWSTGDVKAKRKAESNRLKEKNEQGLAKKATIIRWEKEGAAENQSKKMKKFWEEIGHPEGCLCAICKAVRGETKGEGNSMYGKTPWNKRPTEIRICELKNCVITFECSIDSKKRFCSLQCSGKSRRGVSAWNSGLTKETDSRIEAYGKKVSAAKKKRNHKVISVKRLTKRLDVYDLSIEKYHNFALTSGVFVHNTGKSRAAIIGIAYSMHTLLCLKDPWGYFHKDAAGKMAIVFFNLNKTLSESKGFNILQNYLLHSDWFLARGRVSGTVERKIHFPLFEYILASPQAEGEVGQDVILALMDEVDSPKSTMKTKEKVIKSVESALRRLENRFVENGQTLGKFFIVASKQERAAFIDAFVTKRKNNPEVHVVDMPVWEAEERAEYGDKKFAIRLGDLYTPSKIMDDPEEIRKTLADGFRIVQIPDTPKFRRAFMEDIVGALRDFAGISVSYMRKNKLFKTEKYLLDCYDKNKLDPIKVVSIELGTKDEKDLIHFLDVEKIRMPRGVPRCIHGDIAYAHGINAYGLAMSGISGWSKVNRENEYGEIVMEKLPAVETDFVMRIVAPEGDEIPMSRVRKFIIDLKKIYNFNIVLASFDLVLASKDTSQILEKAGIECDYMSLDKKPEIYRSFRDIVKEQRWTCHNHPYLHFELANLEDDPITNKIDHPEEVVVAHVLPDGSMDERVIKGSKDCSDSVAGSAMKAIEKCEMPPDIEIMKRALETATKSEELPPYWWVNESSMKGPMRETKSEESKPSKGFTNLFRKSQNGS